MAFELDGDVDEEEFVQFMRDLAAGKFSTPSGDPWLNSPEAQMIRNDAVAEIQRYAMEAPDIGFDIFRATPEPPAQRLRGRELVEAHGLEDLTPEQRAEVVKELGGAMPGAAQEWGVEPESRDGNGYINSVRFIDAQGVARFRMRIGERDPSGEIRGTKLIPITRSTH